MLPSLFVSIISAVVVLVMVRAAVKVVTAVAVKGGKDSGVGGKKKGEFEACKCKPLVFLTTPTGE